MNTEQIRSDSSEITEQESSLENSRGQQSHSIKFVHVKSHWRRWPKKIENPRNKQRGFVGRVGNSVPDTSSTSPDTVGEESTESFSTQISLRHEDSGISKSVATQVGKEPSAMNESVFTEVKGDSHGVLISLPQIGEIVQGSLFGSLKTISSIPRFAVITTSILIIAGSVTLGGLYLYGDMNFHQFESMSPQEVVSQSESNIITSGSDGPVIRSSRSAPTTESSVSQSTTITNSNTTSSTSTSITTTTTHIPTQKPTIISHSRGTAVSTVGLQCTETKFLYICSTGDRDHCIISIYPEKIPAPQATVYKKFELSRAYDQEEKEGISARCGEKKIYLFGE